MDESRLNVGGIKVSMYLLTAKLYLLQEYDWQTIYEMTASQRQLDTCVCGTCRKPMLSKKELD